MASLGLLILVLLALDRQDRECGIYPSQTSSPYVLPYPVGERYAVWRTFTHYTPGNRGVGLYAIDFQMPIGSTIVAARAGIVVAVRDSFPDNNNIDLQENYVMIRHADGTIARYLHLTRRGALVKLGDRVRAGQKIARSGNSGQSTGPHLHFDVQTCGPNLPPNYNQLPCGRTVPVSFQNTRSHACGLEPGQRYSAQTPGPAVDPTSFNRAEAGVKEALYHYLLAHQTGDPDYARRAFDPQGFLYWVDRGKRMSQTAAEYIASQAGKPAPDEANRRRRVSEIQIAGDVAMARVDLSYPAAQFVDFMTLLRVNDEWRIVSRAYQRSESRR